MCTCMFVFVSQVITDDDVDRISLCVRVVAEWCAAYEEHFHCRVSQFPVFHAGFPQEGR